MACNKIAFDDFEPIKADNISESRTLDSESCFQLCKNETRAKSYHYYDKKCICLAKSPLEILKRIEKLGAPKGCFIELKKELCVSSSAVARQWLKGRSPLP
jgi:hypothetical protein